jgi:hypothetical protein
MPYLGRSSNPGPQIRLPRPLFSLNKKGLKQFLVPRLRKVVIAETEFESWETHSTHEASLGDIDIVMCTSAIIHH